MSLLAVRDLSVDFHTTSRIVHAVRGVSFDGALRNAILRAAQILSGNGAPD